MTIEEILHRALAESTADVGQPAAHADLVTALESLEPAERRILRDALAQIAP